MSTPSDSFSAERKIERVITNDTNPAMSTVDILSSLKLIGHFEEQIKDGKGGASTKLAEHELRYLRAGAEEISKNGVFQERFGGGLNGAMAVASLLKQRHSERVTKQLLDNALDGTAGLALDETISRLDSGKAVSKE
jgi:hypothetical protein